ncbi:leukemia-associated protein 7 [Lissotriton helveticus]
MTTMDCFTHSNLQQWKKDLALDAHENHHMARQGPLLASISHQTVALKTLRHLQQKKGLSPEGSSVPAGTLDGGGTPHTHQDGGDTSRVACDTGCRVARAESDPEQQCSSRTTERSAEGRLRPTAHSGRQRALAARRSAQPAASHLSGSGRVTRTLAERASDNRLSRVTDLTSQLLSVEQCLLTPLAENQPLGVHLKDSIEFRNICSHMALQLEGQDFDRDLIAAHHCLKDIVMKLIQSLATFPPDSHDDARSALREILQNIPDI